jgi:hypothetical protein
MERRKLSMPGFETMPSDLGRLEAEFRYGRRLKHIVTSLMFPVFAIIALLLALEVIPGHPNPEEAPKFRVLFGVLCAIFFVLTPIMYWSGLGAHNARFQIYEHGYVFVFVNERKWARWEDVFGQSLSVHGEYWWLTITLVGGETTKIGNIAFTNGDMCQILFEVNRKKGRKHVAELLPRILAGEPLLCGPLTLSKDAIGCHGKVVPWSEFQRFSLASRGEVIIHTTRERIPTRCGVRDTDDLDKTLALGEALKGHFEESRTA